MIQLVLHLHECADPAPAKSTTATESVAAESGSKAAESTAEPLHSVDDYASDCAAAGAAPTETS
jgi:hypothetical protein